MNIGMVSPPPVSDRPERLPETIDAVPDEEDFGSSAHDAIPSALEPLPGNKSDLVSQVKKTNLSLAAALDKATKWEWTDGALLLIFKTSYEANLVKNQAETLRRAGTDAGMAPFSVDIQTETTDETEPQDEESPRVALVRQVFRGQVLKG